MCPRMVFPHTRRCPLASLHLLVNMQTVASTRDSQDHRPAGGSGKGSDVIIGSGTRFSLLAAKKYRKDSQHPGRRTTGVFVSRLTPNTRADAISAHIRKETGLQVRCEPVQTKHDSYSSFHIHASRRDVIGQLLDTDLWPKNILVRPLL